MVKVSGKLTEVELIIQVYGDGTKYETGLGAKGKTRLVFRNNISKKVLNLLLQQYKSDMRLQGLGLAKGGALRAKYEQYISDITVQDLQDSIQRESSKFGRNWKNRYKYTTIPTTISFVQWNWSAIWSTLFFNQGLMDNWFEWHQGNKIKKEEWVGAKAWLNTKVVMLWDLKIHHRTEPSKLEDFEHPTSSDRYIQTLFVDSILGGGCDWGIVNTEALE